MKKSVKIVAVCLALMFVLSFVIVGVFAALSSSTSISATVSWEGTGMVANVRGKVTGYDSSKSTINNATYSGTTKNSATLSDWDIGTLIFQTVSGATSRESQAITIRIAVTNVSESNFDKIFAYITSPNVIDNVKYSYRHAYGKLSGSQTWETDFASLESSGNFIVSEKTNNVGYVALNSTDAEKYIGGSGTWIVEVYANVINLSRNVETTAFTYNMKLSKSEFSDLNLIPNGSISSTKSAKVYGNTIQQAVPSEYQQVEYLTTPNMSSVSYLTTNWCPDFTSDFKISGSFSLVTTGTRSLILGNYLGSSSSENFSIEITTGNKLRVYSGGDIAVMSTSLSANTTYSYSISYNSTSGLWTIVCAGETKSATSLKNFVCTNAIRIGNSDYRGSASFYPVSIYATKILDNNDKVLYNYVPCYLKSNSVAGVYDIINNTFCANSGTATFSNSDTILSSDYQQVEYLESTGTQYIDTGVIQTNKATVDCKFYTLSVVSNYLYGATQYNSMMYNGLYRNNSLEYNWQVVSFTASSTIEMTQRISGSNTIITINGVQYTKGTGTTARSATISIFACRRADDSLRTYGNLRCYYFKMYDDDGFIIRNYVPCYRKLDNVAGLYDMVNNVFYSNAGTGSFAVGENIETNNITPTPEVPYETKSLGENSVNLLDYSAIIARANTSVSQIENGVNINGYTAGRIELSDLKANTDYYLKFTTENVVNTRRLVRIFADTTTSTTLASFSNGTGGTFNTGNNTTINIWFYCGSGTEASAGEVNFTNIQLEEGTTATDYKPYHYIDINNSSVNLFDISSLDLSKCFESYGGGLYTIGQRWTNISVEGNSLVVQRNNSSTGDNIYFGYFKGGTTLTFQCDNIMTSTNNLAFYICDNYFPNTTTRTLITSVSKSLSYCTFTMPSDGYLYFSIFIQQVVSSETYSNIKLQLGSTATAYEAYRAPVSITIDLTGHEPLRKVGDVADYLDTSNGVIIRNIGKVVLTGTETWSISNSGTSAQYYLCKLANYRDGIDNYNLNSHFTQQEITSSTTIQGSYVLNSSAYNAFQVNIRPDISVYPTVLDWTTFLAGQYASGTPVTICYQLSVPVVEMIDCDKFELWSDIANYTVANDKIITASNIAEILSSDYIELDYLSMSGTQYINTGITPTNLTKVEVSYNPLSDTNRYVFGSVYSTNVGATGGLGLLVDSNGNPVSVFNGASSAQTGITLTNANNVDIISANGYYHNGELINTFSASTFNSVYNIYLGAVNVAGSANSYFKGNISYLKIWENEKLVRYFVPCINSDGVVGFFDVVYNNFYRNSGTGLFTSGTIND